MGGIKECKLFARNLKRKKHFTIKIILKILKI